MPRKPKIHILSPFDPKLLKREPPLSLIPAPVVKGLVRGILSHLWRQERRTTREVGISQEAMELMLWEYAQLAAQPGGGLAEADLIKRMERDLPGVFAPLTGHSYFIFAAQSDLIIGNLDKCSPPYSSLNEVGKRLVWIKENLADALAVLKLYRPCYECRMNTSLPSDEVLLQWASTANVGELRDFLLAYFHNELSTSTVKQILATKQKMPNS